MSHPVRALLVLAIFAVLCRVPAYAAPSIFGAGWVVARSSHFEVFSDAGVDQAKLALTHFEELRSFFDVNHLVPAITTPEIKSPVRIIAFNSRQEYDSFKLRPGADAYYNGSLDRDYIVMPIAGRSDFSVAAHEYAHFLLHSAGLKLPAWLSEGLAEVFSTVTFTARQTEFGGQLPVRVQTLRREPWLSAADLLAADPDSSLRSSPSGSSIFYAESWAIADMLTSSPEYAARFGGLIRALRTGDVTSAQAFVNVYNQSPDAIISAAKYWIARNRSFKQTLPFLAPERFAIRIAQVSEFESRALLADLLLANGELNRAEQIYKDLLHQSPSNPDVLASLGAVALRKGDRNGAVHYWHLALDHGLTDATLCYRYASVADEMGLPSNEIESALERAIQIKPNFQDALYKLALLKSNAGDYSAAVDKLQSMSNPQPNRAFAYWTALAYALGELGRRDESVRAANQAMTLAASSQERARAAELAYIATTDLAVQFARDADGKLQLVTTRVPHGTTDFNPFVEPGDRVQVATGTLREVQCGDGRLTGFLVQSDRGLLTLAVPDPLHVLIRNGPSEFNCGPQTSRNVRVEYAAAAKFDSGILRGLEFR